MGQAVAPAVGPGGTLGTPSVPGDADALRTRIDALKAEIACLEQGIRAIEPGEKRS